MVQIQKIAGSAERFMAMAELLLLLLFVFVILALYIKGQRKEEKGKEMPIGKKGTYEENYEQFLQWIAEELFIAETTVKKHVTHVYEKCGVSGRKELKEHWRNFT